MKAIHMKIKGEVQGVFFRANTKKQAEELNVKDWIKNLPNGEVEAFFEGKEDKVENIFLFCKQGPPGSIVEKTYFEEQTPIGYKEFEIIK